MIWSVILRNVDWHEDDGLRCGIDQGAIEKEEKEDE